MRPRALPQAGSEGSLLPCGLSPGRSQQTHSAADPPKPPPLSSPLLLRALSLETAREDLEDLTSRKMRPAQVSRGLLLLSPSQTPWGLGTAFNIKQIFLTSSAQGIKKVV